MKKSSLCFAFVLFCQISFSTGKVLPDSLGTNASTAASATDLLNGTVSGLIVTPEDGNPYGMSNITIRGINSMFNDNQPLWIVDGVYVSTDVNKNRDAFWQYPDNTYTTPQNPLAFLSPREIESITVLKNISATAVYGARGANGVIIVRTKRRSGVERNMDLNSNIGVNFDGDGNIVPVQNYRLSLNGQSKNGTNTYVFSLNYANGKGTLEKSSMDYGTLRASFETRANKVIHFGFNSIIGIGNTSSPFPGATWNASEYDDDSKDYRALVSSWIRFNLGRTSVISVDASLDYEDNDRFIWYGKGTTFGAIDAEYINGGAAAILESSILNYNLDTRYTFQKYFDSDHFFKFDVAGQFYGNKELLNVMNGRNFSNHSLRAKGLVLKGTNPENHLYPNSYSHYGAYASLQYKFKEIVGLSGAFRADYFPKYLKNGISYYPSVEGFVNFATLFDIPKNVISDISLRGGYGIAGKEIYVPYNLLEDEEARKNVVPEPWTEFFYDGLLCQRTSEFNISFNTTFINRRLNASVTYYNRRTSDRINIFNFAGNPEENKSKIYYHFVDPVSKYDFTNYITGKGIELELNAEIVRTENVNWSVGVNAANSIHLLNNAPIKGFIGYVEDGNGMLVDQTGEGFISPSDIVMFGSRLPKYYGALSSALKLGPVSFDVLIDGAAGFKVLLPGGTTSKYISDGDFFRVSHIGASYDIPVKAKWISGLSLNLSARNIYSNEKKIYLYPSMKTVMIGVNAKF